MSCDEQPTRRQFLATGLACLALPTVASCVLEGADTGPIVDAPRLAARPARPASTIVPGNTWLGIGHGRDGILWVPRTYSPETPAPIVVALHGAGGAAASWSRFQTLCGTRDMILLAVDSRGSTWDRVRGHFGPDVVYLDEALAYTFEHCNVDPARVALGGFSDGASYALSLGATNGDLFSRLIAFSPGFFWPADRTVGKPRVFVSHGRSDPIINVKTSRDRIVPALRAEGYEVTYREFEGGHEVPDDVAAEALDWLLV